MDIDILPEYLPLIVHKMFRDPAAASKSEKTQILQLKITDDNIEEDEMTLVGSDTRFDRREVTLSVGTTADLTEIATNIFSNELPLENVEMFELIIVERYNKNIVANTRIYCKMLEGMKSINRVRIDVPAAFKEKSNSQNNSPEKYPLVRELTINATSGAKFQSLLNRFSLIFPNLQHLYIRYFCGEWKRWMGEFQLMLPVYSLASLTIDITPVKVNMKKFLNKQQVNDEDFFVIQLDLLHNSKQYLFKVFINDMKSTRINHEDIEGLQRGKDYLRIHVIMMNLKQLTLYRNNSMIEKDETEEYGSDMDLQERILFNEDIVTEISI